MKRQHPPRGGLLMSGLRTVRAGLLGVLVLASTAAAQQVRWKDPGPLGVGQRSALDLVFENSEPRGRVTLPHIDALSVVGAPSQETSLSLVNGHRQSRYTLSYKVQPQRKGQIAIPAFEVETDSGTQTVAAATFDVGAAQAGASARQGEPAGDAAFARLAPSARKPYAGEVFDVDVLVGVKGGRRAELTGTPSWDTSGLIAEPFGEGKRIALGGGAAGVRFHTRAVAPQPGPVDVAPVQQDLRIQSTARKHGSLFGRPDFDSLFDDDWDSF